MLQRQRKEPPAEVRIQEAGTSMILYLYGRTAHCTVAEGSRQPGGTGPTCGHSSFPCSSPPDAYSIFNPNRSANHGDSLGGPLFSDTALVPASTTASPRAGLTDMTCATAPDWFTRAPHTAASANGGAGSETAWKRGSGKGRGNGHGNGEDLTTRGWRPHGRWRKQSRGLQETIQREALVPSRALLSKHPGTVRQLWEA
jgi:hypothetical protein